MYASGTGEGRESSVLLYVQSGVYEFSIITQFGVYIIVGEPGRDFG